MTLKRKGGGRGKKGEARQSEAQLQRAVVDFLRLRRFTVWEGLKGIAGRGTSKRAVFQTEGVPDLTLFKAADNAPLLLYVELKIPGGELSAAQHTRHCELAGAGIPVYLAWSLEGIQGILALHGQWVGAVSEGEGWMRAGTGWAWEAWGTGTGYPPPHSGAGEGRAGQGRGVKGGRGS